MPLGYLAVWVALNAVAVLYQGGLPRTVGAWAEFAATAFLGGLLWGWILWRFWLYRKFPAAGRS